MFGNGKLKLVSKTKGKKSPSDKDSSVINTFCALKVLYKVFDLTPGGLNGQPKQGMIDSTISYIDIPLASCMALEEILLRNSTRLPDTSRALGNFLVSLNILLRSGKKLSLKVFQNAVKKLSLLIFLLLD